MQSRSLLDQGGISSEKATAAAAVFLGAGHAFKEGDFPRRSAKGIFETASLGAFSEY
jgi:hypothetical protein